MKSGLVFRVQAGLLEEEGDPWPSRGGLGASGIPELMSVSYRWFMNTSLRGGDTETLLLPFRSSQLKALGDREQSTAGTLGR